MTFCKFSIFSSRLQNSANEGFVGILNDDLVRVGGICISPDGKRLVAAEPDASRVVVFDIPKI